MKKYLYIIPALLMLFSFKSQAQVIPFPNGGFENWDPFGSFEVPSNDWVTSDLLWHANGLFTNNVISDPHSHSGKFSARIAADTGIGKIWPGFAAINFAFNKRASYLLFYYTDSLNAVDHGRVTVSLFKYNAVSKKKDSLGGAIWTFPVKINKNFAYVEIPIGYAITDTTRLPDTASVKIFLSTSSTAGQPGHVLVDDIAMIVGTGKMGIEEPQLSDGILMYPNPTSGLLNIASMDIDQPIKNVEITDINGRVIKTMLNPMAGGYQIDLSGEPDGLYFLKSTYGNSFAVNKLMVRH